LFTIKRAQVPKVNLVLHNFSYSKTPLEDIPEAFLSYFSDKQGRCIKSREEKEDVKKEVTIQGD